MSALQPAETSRLFERYFADGDLDGLMSLYEEEAVFPTAHGTSTGHDEIRATLKAYLDSGAKLEFGESLVFAAGKVSGNGGFHFFDSIPLWLCNHLPAS